MSVGGLMAMMVPVALYCMVGSLTFRINPYHPDDPLGDVTNAAILLLLLLLASSGVFVAVYRRAELRDAVIQWSVPPGFLLAGSAVKRLVVPESFPTLVFTTGIVLIGLALSWVVQERSGHVKQRRGDWILRAIYAGFAHVGILLLNFLTCGIVGLFLALIVLPRPPRSDPSRIPDTHDAAARDERRGDRQRRHFNPGGSALLARHERGEADGGDDPAVAVFRRISCRA